MIGFTELTANLAHDIGLGTEVKTMNHATHSPDRLNSRSADAVQNLLESGCLLSVSPRDKTEGILWAAKPTASGRHIVSILAEAQSICTLHWTPVSDQILIFPLHREIILGAAGYLARR